MNLKLDPCWGVVTRHDGEVEPISIEDASRDGHLNDVMEEQRARTIAARAPFGPGLTAAAALVAGQSYRHLERQRDSATRLARRDMDRRMPPRRRIIHQEPSADTIHGQRHRREIDDHFVGETTHVHTAVVGCHEGNWLTTEWTEGVSCHQSAGTIGIGRGEVNGQ